MREFLNLVTSKRKELSGLTYDADSFGNSNKYRASYNIPDDEELLVYVSSGICKDLLRGKGTLITDEAIYVHPEADSGNDEKRIPLSDVCSYLIYDNINSQVKLLGIKCEYQIYSGVSEKEDDTAKELVKLLRLLQDSLMLSSANRKSYESTIKGIYLLVRGEFSKRGVLSGDLLSVLQAMEEIRYIRQDVLLTQFENSYRKCNDVKYKILLSKKRELLPEETVKVLNNPDMLFYTSFIRDLLDSDLFTDTNNVIKIYLNLKAKKRLTISEATILCCLCLKIEDYDYMNSILAKVGNDINEGDLWLIKASLARRKNRNMAKLQADFAAGNELSPNDMKAVNDIGLSILHYTLMLRDKELILKLLPAFEGHSPGNPFSNIPMINAMYDPMFLASNIFKDYGLLTKIFIYTSSKAAPINKSIKRLDAMIDINIALKKKKSVDREGLSERISELRAVRRDLKEELKRLARSEVACQRRMVTLIRETGHVFCSYLLDLFLKEDGFDDWMQSTEENYRISKYKDIFFVTNPGCSYGMSSYTFSHGMVIDTNVLKGDRVYSGTGPREGFESETVIYYENPAFKSAAEEERRRREREKQKRKEEFKERVRACAPYQGGWFSELARENIQALKAEYRVLVKKYHPDSSGDNKTAGALMRIMTERAEILDSMMKNS